MPNGLAVGQRIESRRKQLGLTLDDIANEIGVARSTIQRYEKGSIDKLKLPVIEAISRVLKVNPAWLCCKSDDMTPVTVAKSVSATIPTAKNIMPLPTTYKVPLLGKIACGCPILAVEEAEEVVSIPDYVKADFALRCSGDSMINARIFDGDIVYIRAQPEVESGEIAAVRIEDEATLKRVQLFEDHISLEPENPMYRPLVIWGEDMNNVEILGKAVAFSSMII